jgi:hypothetical protein
MLGVLALCGCHARVHFFELLVLFHFGQRGVQRGAAHFVFVVTEIGIDLTHAILAKIGTP